MPRLPTSSRPRLVAVILAKNEAAHIPACIYSLKGAGDWLDAVVVWDSGSTDATRALAQAAGALVVHRPFDNYANQRQSALDTLAADWIFFVDADERIPPALAEEIQARLADDADEADDTGPPVDGYWVARRNFIAGRETLGGGFFPDYQLRLLRRDAAQYAPRAVHEIVEVAGETRRLAQPMLHYNYRNWSQFHHKQRFYARFEAADLAARDIRPRPHNFIVQPLREFIRRFITLNGRRDGRHGLLLALLLAWYYGFMPYWYLLGRGPVEEEGERAGGPL